MWTLPSLYSRQKQAIKESRRFNSPSLHQSRRELLAPPLLTLHDLSIVKLSTVLALLAHDDDADTASLKVPRSKRADSTKTTRTEVDSMSGSLRELRRDGPVDGRREDLLAKRASYGGGDLLDVGTWNMG